MKNLLNQVNKSGNIILFIDEIHTIIGAGSTEGSANDVANMLKAALARGELQVISMQDLPPFFLLLSFASSLVFGTNQVLLLMLFSRLTSKVLIVSVLGLLQLMST